MNGALSEMMKKMMRGEATFGGMSDDPLAAAMADNQVPRTREQRIERHQQQVRQIDEVAGFRKKVSTHDSIRKIKSTTTLPYLKTLQPICASELKVSRTPYKGRAFYCTVVVPCAIMNSAQTLVDEGDGGDVISLHVYNLDNPREKLWVGRQIVILEPFYKMRADGSPGVRVDCPAEILFDVEAPTSSPCPTISKAGNDTSAGSQPATKFNDSARLRTDVQRASSSHIPSIPKRRPEMHRNLNNSKIAAFRDKGNASFQSGEYGLAEKYYTSALKLVGKMNSHREEKERTGTSENSVDLWVLHSHRSMARLKQGNLDLGLKDATMCHLCAPEGPTKPIIRCAQALVHLGYRLEALEALQNAKVGKEFQGKEAKLLEDMISKVKVIKILRVGQHQEFKTISAALFAAPPEAEIMVDAGLYKESIVVTKPVILRSMAPFPDELEPIHTVGGGSKWAEIRADSFHAVSVQCLSKVPLSEVVRIIGFRIVAAGPVDGHFHSLFTDRRTLVLRHCTLASSFGPVLCAENAPLIVEDCVVVKESEL
jgi:hypothetical protein